MTTENPNPTPDPAVAPDATVQKPVEKPAEQPDLLFDVKDDKKVEDQTPEQKAEADAKALAEKAEADKIAAMTPEEKAAYEKEKADKALADEKATFVKLDDIKLPEDMPIPDEVKGKLSGIIDKHKIAGDAGKAMTQDLIDLHVDMQNKQIEAWQEMKAGWRKEIVDDPVLGGANLEATKKSANDVVRKFASDPAFGGSPELLQAVQDDLIMLGLGNKKSFMKLLLNIEAATKNGSIAGTGGTGDERKSTEKVLWPGMA